MTEEPKVCPFRQGYCTNQCVFYNKDGILRPQPKGDLDDLIYCEILAWMLRQ